MILYVNACVRPVSRTKYLADKLIAEMQDTDIKRINLEEITFPKVDNAFIDRRDELISRESFDDDLFCFARDFAAADTIVMAAPFWDLSFPSMLKQYLEQICVAGITFKYENDIPVGLCKAENLYYVTTAGGPIFNAQFGYGYLESLAKTFYGIQNCHFIHAENLDIAGADVGAILKDAEENIRALKLD